ncbi:hypothetical protein M8J77_001972 [Diaphorina citri]|nr:hypothetical protein M8J77_001972 [Diaphorina citri]
MYLSYTFFKNYPLNMVYPSIRPGTQLKVNNIRALRLEIDHCTMYFHVSYVQIKRIFYSIPITTSKWKHLQELKAHIPADCHAFYDTIRHH